MLHLTGVNLECEMLWNSSFVCGKLEAYRNQPSLPSPHQSMLGNVRRRETQFEVSTLYGGSGGWFYRKACKVVQQFCPRLYPALVWTGISKRVFGLSFQNGSTDLRQNFRMYRKNHFPSFQIVIGVIFKDLLTKNTFFIQKSRF